MLTRSLGALALLVAAVTPLLAAETLTYHGGEGRVAEYRLTLTATGQQTSLGVRRPVRVQAEYAVREQVLSVEPDASRRVQRRARITQLKDPTGAFAGARREYPATEILLSPRGEVLESAPPREERAPQLADRAAALLAAIPSVILPEEPVEVGATWEWEKEGAKQTNRLAARTVGDKGRARLSTKSASPISVREASEALGLTVVMTGQESSTGDVEFAPDLGLVVRHKGKAAVQTHSQVSMESPEGERTFPMDLQLRIVFDLKLLRVDGKAP